MSHQTRLWMLLGGLLLLSWLGSALVTPVLAQTPMPPRPPREATPVPATEPPPTEAPTPTPTLPPLLPESGQTGGNSALGIGWGVGLLALVWLGLGGRTLRRR